MSLTIPLTVRLSTARADIHITRQVRDLRLRTVVPGGFASATVWIDRPLSVQPDEIAYYGRLIIHDARNGNVVWEGRLEDPGRSAGPDGQVWELTAVGPSAHAQDRTIPLIYVDKRLDPWIRVENVTPGGTFGLGTDPGAAGNPDPVTQSLLYQFPQGLGLVTNSRVVARYDLLRVTGQKLGRLDYTWDAGVTSASNRVQALCRVDGGNTSSTARDETWTTAGSGSSPRVIVTDFASGRNTLDLRIIYTGGGVVVNNDISWAALSNILIMATRYNQSGTELLQAADYTTNTVLASQIVADLLGRLLTQYDGTNASIATTTHPIDQLAYPDGTTPARILDDLMGQEPLYYWAAWERNPVTGKYRFEFVAWPTYIRYEASAADGYDSTGSAAGLWSAVSVRWRDTAGEIRTTRRTQTVPALTAAGLERETQIDLGDEVGSQAAAEQAGDEFLADHQHPPNAGRLVIARPIQDLITGRTIQPWEIRPGQLIRVRGILPRPDALNATGRDGVTVFRIVAAEYSATTAAAVLELDSFAPSTARALAELRRRPALRRRR